MIKISFILPMYKAEKYLVRVINSLKAQTMKDFEAIFVDDGSPDKSAEICEKLFENDTRFKLIRKENGGVSSARNAGLDAAEGKYIFFVDPDDCIEAESAEVLWETAERENADIVFFGRVNDYYKDGVLTKSEISLPKVEGVFRDNPCQKHFDKIATSYFVTDKLFKRELIEKYNIRFKNVNIGEDGVFYAEYIRQSPKCAVFLNKPLYRYTTDETATLSVSYHREREKDNFYLSNAMCETVKAWGMSEEPICEKTVKYCIVLDLQLGIKNINLGNKKFSDKYMWLKNIMADDKVRRAVRDTSIDDAESRNDKIKLMLLKLHMYRAVVYISGLNRKGGKK